MKIVLDGISLRVGGALSAFVSSVMPCSLPSCCKLVQTEGGQTEGFQVSYRMMFIREIVRS
jgi:hypothetical protein